jgi:hypothetical protein
MVAKQSVVGSVQLHPKPVVVEWEQRFSRSPVQLFPQMTLASLRLHILP